MLICDSCDRAFHLGCLIPKRTEIPEGKWYCSDCHLCAGCNQPNFDTVENMEDMAKVVRRRDEKFKDILFCESCFGYIQAVKIKKNIHYNIFHSLIFQRQFCPVCWQAIPEDSGGNFIYCDNCSLCIFF